MYVMLQSVLQGSSFLLRTRPFRLPLFAQSCTLLLSSLQCGSLVLAHVVNLLPTLSKLTVFIFQ